MLCHGVSVPPQSKMTALTAMPRILRIPTVSPPARTPVPYLTRTARLTSRTAQLTRAARLTPRTAQLTRTAGPGLPGNGLKLL